MEGMEIEHGGNKEMSKIMRDCIGLNLELPRCTTIPTVQNLLFLTDV